NRPRITALACCLPRIQTQTRSLLVGTVAGVTMFGEDRPYVARIVDRFARRFAGGEQCENNGNRPRFHLTSKPVQGVLLRRVVGQMLMLVCRSEPGLGRKK